MLKKTIICLLSIFVTLVGTSCVIADAQNNGIAPEIGETTVANSVLQETENPDAEKMTFISSIDVRSASGTLSEKELNALLPYYDDLKKAIDLEAKQVLLADFVKEFGTPAYLDNVNWIAYAWELAPGSYIYVSPERNYGSEEKNQYLVGRVQIATGLVSGYLPFDEIPQELQDICFK